MTGFGIQQEEIANALGIDRKTMTKYFRRELDTGATEANVRVAQALYTNAVKNMSVAAQIWWTKTRMGWKEAQDVNIGGTNTPIHFSFEWAPATPVDTIEATVDTNEATPTLEVEWDPVDSC